MDVTLPNGQIINGVPDGTSKEDVMQKAISSGLATLEDFPTQKVQQPQGPNFEGFDPMKNIELFGVSGEDVAGAGNIAANVGTGLLAKPIAGVYGLRDVVEGEGIAGAETVKRVTEKLQTPMSEEGVNLAGKIGEGLKGLMDNPGINAIVEGAKDAKDLFAKIGEWTGAVATGDVQAVTKSIKGEPQTTGSKAEMFQNIGGSIAGAFPEAAMDVAAFVAPGSGQALKTASIPTVVKAARNAMKAKTLTDDALKPIADVIKKGAPEDLANLVKADPAFYKAAAELGINIEPLASFASKNPQFVSVEAGLASVPASVLDVQAKLFINNLSKKADDIIEAYGGTLDKTQMNIDFPKRSMEVVDDLAQQADDIYSSIAQILPKYNKYPLGAGNTVDFIKKTAISLGGVNELPSKLKGMLASLKGSPTLGKIDQLRKEIGQALHKKSGPFKNSEQGQLKALYARLSSDQDLIAANAGMSNITDSAKNLIIKRKQIEDNLIALLGKDLSGSLTKAVGGAIKGLSKSEIGNFQKVINAIPKKYRAESIMTSMNDVFKGVGPNQQSLSAPQFVKWYETLNRSPAAKKALFKELPKDSATAIDNLYKVSKGVSSYLGDKVHTGRLNAMFNEDTGFIRRMVGKIAPTAVAISTGSPTASMMTNATIDFIKQGSGPTQSASNMLGSPTFQNLIKQFAIDGSISSGELSRKALLIQKTMKKTRQYKDWVKTLGSEQSESLQKNGLLGYLFATEATEGKTK